MGRKKEKMSDLIETKSNYIKEDKYAMDEEFTIKEPDLTLSNYGPSLNIKRDLNDFHSDKNELSISSLKRRIKSPKHFIFMFGMELKYHLPPKHNVTWPFIIKILTGEKRLVKLKDIPFLQAIPKIEEFQMKKIWPAHKNDKDFCRYLPDVEPDRYPPRNYFFQILSSRKNKIFNTLLQTVKTKRKKKMEKKNQIVKINPIIWTEIKSTRFEEAFVTSRPSKRIVLKKKKNKKMFK